MERSRKIGENNGITNRYHRCCFSSGNRTCVPHKAKCRRSGGAKESTPVEEAYIPEELEEYLRELKRNGQPIKAIQKLRNVTGMSLSEAKQFVDDIII